MGFMARLKSLFGGGMSPASYQLVAADGMTLPSTLSYVEFTNTSDVTLTTLVSQPYERPRLLCIVNTGAGDITITHSANSTTAGQFICNGNNMLLTGNDTAIFVQRSDGVWVRFSGSLNN